MACCRRRASASLPGGALRFDLADADGGLAPTRRRAVESPRACAGQGLGQDKTTLTVTCERDRHRVNATRVILVMLPNLFFIQLKGKFVLCE